MFDDDQISSKISQMLKEKDINADVEVIFSQLTIYILHVLMILEIGISLATTQLQAEIK